MFKTAVTYVLIMLWSGTELRTSPAVLTQEFGSYEMCELARKEIAKAHNIRVVIVSQGCYRKNP